VRRLLLLPVILLAACGDGRLPQIDLVGEALGTTFKVSIVEPAASLDTDALEADIVAALARVDALASTWRDDSELATLNAADSTDWIDVSDAFCSALADSWAISRVSGGAFDATIGPLVNLWGFGPNGRVVVPPTDAAIGDAMQHVGYDKVELDCDNARVRKSDPLVYVDLSGWAKGYAVDEVAEVLAGRQLANFLVEVGGEMRVSGHNSEARKWAVAIEAPSTSERVPQSIIRITDTGVATSGDYRNYFEYDGVTYSHTIDPRTGRPVTHDLAAVTILQASSAFADAMATALLVLGPHDGPELAEELGIAAYFLIRAESGIEEITTNAFEAVLDL
jgi:thiamine biosynthesis lipoprotein